MTNRYPLVLNEITSVLEEIQAADSVIVDNIIISNTVNVIGSANLQSSANVAGTFRAIGATTFSNTVAITGAATFSNTMAITGVATFSTTIAGTANNSLNIGGSSLSAIQAEITSNAAAAYANATGKSANATNINTGTLKVENGGTGQISYTNGQILIGTTSNTLTKATLTAGNGIVITNGSGSIEIAVSPELALIIALG